MRNGCIVAAVTFIIIVMLGIGFVVYTIRLYDQRRSVDEANLNRVNLEAGILSREGHVYHVIFERSHVNFRDTDLRHLADLKHLELVWFEGSPITDQGLEQLASLKNLRSIMLSNTRVTEDGVNQLRKALPHAEILVFPRAPVPTN
jgi:hypothetical protein